MKKTSVMAILLLLAFCVAESKTILTVDKVRDLAMEHNRQLQSARKELDRAKGDIISARAGALPQISLDGRYTRNIEEAVMFIQDLTGETNDVTKIPVTQNNDFNLALSITQPLYNGGKAWTAWSIAKIYEKYSIEVLNQVENDVIYNAEAIFYTAILARSNLDVIQNSFELLKLNLEIVEQFYEQGMASEFELLRARVEKLNLEPLLISAESQLTLTRKKLKSFLGLPLEEEIELVSDFSETALTDLPELDYLKIQALNNRPEIKQARLQVDGYDKAVSIARSDWLRPQINLNTTYTMTGSSNDFKLSGNETSNSWTASVMVSIPLFDGGRTIGEVRKSKTDYYQAQLNEEQMRDDVQLEVEQAYDNLMQSRKALVLQKETISQAEEGLRIANLRYKTGVGTQLEILSAQTALTAAKTNMAQAIFSFRLSKSELKKSSEILE